MSDGKLQAAIDVANAKLAGKASESQPFVKEYHTRFPGSCFIDTKVKRHIFQGGVLRTSDPELIKELDAVTDIVGSPIYTKVPVLAPEDKLPAEENKQRASEVMQQLAAAQAAMSLGAR